MQKNIASFFHTITAQSTIIAVLAIAFLPQSAEAADAARSYDGCFERGIASSHIEIFMKAPVCEVTFNNLSSQSIVYSIEVENLNTQGYEFLKNGSIEIDVTRSEEQADFSITLAPESTTTVTMQPWDYEDNQNDFWFAGFSDPQAKPGGASPNPVFTQIMDQIEIVNPQFTIIAGDLIKGSSSDAAAHTLEYNGFEQTLDTHGNPVFPIPGDHDARQDMEAYYEPRFGDIDVNFTFGNTRFIGINTNQGDDQDEGEISADRLIWIEDQLSAATEDHIIVYMHHPLVPPSWAASIGIKESQRQTLAELFVEYDVDLVLTGDAHGYDNQIINSGDFPGLAGSFQHIVMGGGGGNMANYDEHNHFFILFHVTEDGIDHELIEYDDFDTTLTLDAANDGTAEGVTATLVNEGELTLPYLRLPFHIAPEEGVTPYVANAAGEFSPFESTTVNNVQRGHIEITLAPETTETISVTPRRNLHTNMTNRVNADGIHTFSALPTATEVETGLSVTSTSTSATITVSAWDTTSHSYAWTETAFSNATTTYRAEGLIPNRQYEFYANDVLTELVRTDAEGVASMSYTDDAAARTYRLELDRIIPTSIGVLPGTKGGSNFRGLGENQDLVSAFFAYDEDLEHGYESVWADIDGDNELEIITVPEKGISGHIRAFEGDGTVIAGVFPYGSSFTGGVQLAAADLDGDFIDEIVVGPTSNRRSVVKVYKLENGQLVKQDGIRAHKKKYKKGINLAIGDLDDDGNDEIIVGGNKTRNFKVLNWRPIKQDLRVWTTKRWAAEKTDGVTVAAGDIDQDGKDEIIVGTRHASSDIEAFNFVRSNKKVKSIATLTPFGGKSDNGISIHTANMDKDIQDEIVLTERGANTLGRVDVIEYQVNKERLRRRVTKYPFGRDFSEQVNIALADIDQNWRANLVAAKEDGNSFLKVFRYRRKKKKLVREEGYHVYSRAFGGGVSLTQQQ